MIRTDVFTVERLCENILDFVSMSELKFLRIGSLGMNRTTRIQYIITTETYTQSALSCEFFIEN